MVSRDFDQHPVDMGFVKIGSSQVVTNSQPSTTHARVTQPKANLFDLATSFHEVSDIIQDKKGKVRVLAEAMDMEYSDCANLLVKLHQTDKFLKTELKIEVDGQPMPLKHPLTGAPLCAGDILVDRSGPKFSFPLEDNLGDQFLQADSYKDRLDVANSQKEKARALAKAEGCSISEQELSAAVSVFRTHKESHRKLSDFDLETADFGLLSQAVSVAYAQKTGKEIPPFMQNTVTNMHWMFGGGISSEQIDAAANGANYATMVKKRFETEQKNHKGHRHMLSISASGQESEMDMHYGSTVSYKAQEVTSMQMPGMQKPILVPKFTDRGNESKSESCDVVLDSKPDLMGHISKFDIDKRAVEALKEAVGGNIVDDLLAAHKHSPFNFDKLANQAVDASDQSPKTMHAIAAVTEQYRDEKNFLNNAFLMQEIGRKLSLCEGQLDKTGKLVGNISDIGPLLAGVIENAKDDAEVKPLVDMAKLSYLSSLPRWGVNNENLENIGCFRQNISTEDFQREINAKSYTKQGSKVRESIGFANISTETAQGRLEQFDTAASSLHDFAKGNAPYFEKVAKLKEAMKKGGDDYLQAYGEVREEFGKIIQQMPDLTNQLNLQSEAEKDGLANSMTQKIVEAIIFNERREGAILERQKDKGKALESQQSIGTMVTKAMEAGMIFGDLPAPLIIAKTNSPQAVRMG